MTRKRYLTAAGLLVALACVWLVGTLMLSAETGVQRAKFDQIKKWMTKAEVEEILGVPGFEFPWTGVGNFAWRADNGDLLALDFDAGGRVRYQYQMIRQTMSDKIRRWIGGNEKPCPPEPLASPPFPESFGCPGELEP